MFICTLLCCLNKQKQDTATSVFTSNKAMFYFQCEIPNIQHTLYKCNHARSVKIIKWTALMTNNIPITYIYYIVLRHTIMDKNVFICTESWMYTTSIVKTQNVIKVECFEQSLLQWKHSSVLNTEVTHRETGKHR